MKIIILLILFPTTLFAPRLGDHKNPNIEYIKKLTLFTKLLNAEYGNSSLQAKLNGGSVVLNRLLHPAYPKTLEKVILQEKAGTPQFSGIKSKHFKIDNSNTTKSSLQAAMLLLDKGSILPKNVLFFANPTKSINKKWINTIKNKLYSCDEAHCYYTN